MPCASSGVRGGRPRPSSSTRNSQRSSRRAPGWAPFARAIPGSRGCSTSHSVLACACCSTLLTASWVMASRCWDDWPRGRSGRSGRPGSDCGSATLQRICMPRRSSTGCSRWRRRARRTGKASSTASMASTSRRRSSKACSSNSCAWRCRVSLGSSKAMAFTRRPPTPSCRSAAMRRRSACTSREGRGLRLRRHSSSLRRREAPIAHSKAVKTSRDRLHRRSHSGAWSPCCQSQAQSASICSRPSARQTANARRESFMAMRWEAAAGRAARAPAAPANQNRPRSDAKRTAWARVRTCSLR